MHDTLKSFVGIIQGKWVAEDELGLRFALLVAGRRREREIQEVLDHRNTRSRNIMDDAVSERL